MFKVIKTNVIHSIKDFNPIQIDNRPKYSFPYLNESFKRNLVGGLVRQWVIGGSVGWWVSVRWI